jgi:hypothetical protein
MLNDMGRILIGNPWILNLVTEIVILHFIQEF